MPIVDNEDFIWDAGLLGGWLRFARLDRGYSQAKLAELCGVEPSEIHRIEVGQRECRIETLMKLCGPLGVTPGWILDRTIKPNVSFFSHLIEKESAAKELAAKIEVNFDSVVLSLASAAVLAAILVRSSDPVSRVAIESLPHAGWKKVFQAFALRLGKMGGDDLERAAILHNLNSKPTPELHRQGLIIDKIFVETTKSKGQFSWASWDTRFPREIKWG